MRLRSVVILSATLYAPFFALFLYIIHIILMRVIDPPDDACFVPFALIDSSLCAICYFFFFFLETYVA